MHSDAARSEFFWAANAEDGATRAEVDATPEDERFYIIAGEVIRIRVLAEEFYDVMPKVAPKVIQPAQGGPTQTTATPTAAVHSGPPPYRLQVGLKMLPGRCTESNPLSVFDPGSRTGSSRLVEGAGC